MYSFGEIIIWFWETTLILVVHNEFLYHDGVQKYMVWNVRRGMQRLGSTDETQCKIKAYQDVGAVWMRSRSYCG